MSALKLTVVVASEATAASDPQSLHCGERLLISGPVAMPLHPSQRLLRVDCRAATRMLAFLDHGAQRERGVPTGAIAVRSPMPLEQPDTLATWLLEGLLGNDAQAQQLAALLARQESYRLIRFIAGQDGQQSVAALSARYGLSPAHFYRQCRQALGRSLKQQLRLLRASHALLQYSGGNHTFTDVAADHGYASSSHFCAEIRSLLGASPSEVYQATTPVRT